MREFVMLNVLICAGLSDMWEYKVKNPIIVLGWILGIFIHFMSDGPAGAAYCAFCIAATAVMGFPLFLIGGIGAGDLKLLSVIGCLYGLAFLWRVTLLLIAIAGAISFARLIIKGTLFERVKAFICYLASGRMADEKYYDLKRDGAEYAIRLAPATAAAYFIAMMAA